VIVLQRRVPRQILLRQPRACFNTGLVLCYLSNINIGVGISNYANYLASQKAIFTDEIAKELTHSLMEDVTYFILKGSTKLAKLRKPYSYFKDSEWVKGILPMDLHPVKYKYKLKHNWSKLREDIKQDGVRFSYHFAQAPTASSSIVIGV